MIELDTVYNNTHKFLKAYMTSDFKKYELKHNDDQIFNKVQALVFASLSSKESQNDKNKEVVAELVNEYSRNEDFRTLVNKALNHVQEQYGRETLRFPDGKKVNVNEYINETIDNQLGKGKLNYSERLQKLENKEEIEL